MFNIPGFLHWTIAVVREAQHTVQVCLLFAKRLLLTHPSCLPPRGTSVFYSQRRSLGRQFDSPGHRRGSRGSCSEGFPPLRPCPSCRHTSKPPGKIPGNILCRARPWVHALILNRVHEKYSYRNFKLSQLRYDPASTEYYILETQHHKPFLLHISY